MAQENIGENMHKCDECNALFSFRRGLKSHKDNFHQADKPKSLESNKRRACLILKNRSDLICNLCEFIALSRIGMKAHQTVAHEEKAYGQWVVKLNRFPPVHSV